MSDDLKAAAERAVEAYDAMTALLGPMADGPILPLVEFARQQLAECERLEKEDAEPITEELVRALPGFIPQGYVGFIRLWDEADMILHIQSDLGIVLCAFGNRIRLKDEWVQTKGQLLRLLEALGIERKGG